MRGEPVTVTGGAPFARAHLDRYFSECSPLPLVALEGPEHIARYANPAFERLAGVERSALVGLPFAVAIPEGDSNGCLRALDRVYRTGTPESLADQEHAQGTPAYWSYAIWAILGPDDRPVGVMVHPTDTTEAALFRKKVTATNESLLIASVRQHELKELADSLNERLRAADSHKNHFMAVLSHELRTPLTPVLATVPLLLQDSRLDGETRQALEMIERNVTLEARLIDDLLDLTQVERGLVKLVRQPADLGELIERAARVCRPALEAGRVALDLDLSGGPFVVDGDEVRLQQVFWNLIRNATKFSPPGGRVRVGCRRQGDSWVVAEVSDNGVGIDPALLPQLFRPFQQGDADQVRKFGGLGLGLSLSKELVGLHGGTIAAQSPGPGRGAVFSVTLPVLAGVSLPPSGASAGQPAMPGEGQALRILLVEDHTDSAWAMSRLLNLDGHTVAWAADVASGLRLAAEQPFDLLISDLGLPDGSGLDLMRTLRRQGATLPGITLSGYGQEQDIAQSREAGFATHLTKPAVRDALRSAIRAVVGPPAGP